MPNSPWWTVMFWAILMNGYRPLLVDASLGEDKVSYLIKQSGLR